MESQAEVELTVAVASNFQATAAEIAGEFTKQTGIPVRVSSGSTGKLYAQIVHGAPYDLFLAADTERPRLLQDEGYAVSGSYFVYASGSLVLWSNSRDMEGADCLAELMNGNYSHLAIANPRTAPYGLAAKRYLESQDLWRDAEPKLVYGENIAQTFQFVATGNATFGLIAASQIIDDTRFESGCLETLPDARGQVVTVQQAGVILQRSTNKAAAEQFMHFIKGPDVAALMQRSGYGLP